MVPHITVAAILADLDAKLAEIPIRNTASVRELRRTFSRDLRGDPMVVKALSWALRELAKRDAASFREFLTTLRTVVSALVRREVRTKLLTGRKAPLPHRRSDAAS
ncbi:MAG TPA: DNA alkylation repair protein [Gemmatimonadaceae bacterium]|nr:DNA alkylation repair protein [Gemmatimonadaceae bacterium]